MSGGPGAIEEGRGLSRRPRSATNSGPDDGRRILSAVQRVGHRVSDGGDQRGAASGLVATAGSIFRRGEDRRGRHAGGNAGRVQGGNGHFLQGCLGLSSAGGVAWEYSRAAVSGESEWESSLERGSQRAVGPGHRAVSSSGIQEGDAARGDTHFTQTKHLDRWDEQGVKFVLGIDAMPNLKGLAESLSKRTWKRLHRKAKYEGKTEPRQRPDNVKEVIVRERGFQNIRTESEHVAEFSYSPNGVQEDVPSRGTAQEPIGGARREASVRRHRLLLLLFVYPTPRFACFTSSSRANFEDERRAPRTKARPDPYFSDSIRAFSISVLKAANCWAPRMKLIPLTLVGSAGSARPRTKLGVPDTPAFCASAMSFRTASPYFSEAMQDSKATTSRPSASACPFKGSIARWLSKRRSCISQNCPWSSAQWVARAARDRAFER